MADSGVDWHHQRISLEIADASAEVIQRTLIRLEQETKLQIVENDQVDTGFMLNTVYWRTPVAGTYGGQTWADGVYQNQAGQAVTREKAPEAPLASGAAGLFGVAALYAIYQEMIRPFIWPALQRVAARTAGATIRLEDL